MKLINARVTNFRSVEDSGEFDVEQTLCLVGKNEAGKTAILQALAGLNPHPATPISFDVERDYPRRYLPEYKTRHRGQDAVVITTKWRLDADEKAALSDAMGPKTVTGDVVTLTRRYNATAPQWILPVSETAALEHLIEDERLSAAEKKGLTTTDSKSLVASLEALNAPTEKQARLLKRLKAMPGSSILNEVVAFLSPALPQFMYFSHYDRMEGQIRIDNFTARVNGSQPPAIKEGERVFIDFLEYAGTSVDEITEAKTYEGLNARCEGASNRITQQLMEYWTQNPNLEIEVRVTKAEPEDEPPFNAGIVARARVRNNLHKVTVPFSERSAGFIWFFSFLVKFSQVQKTGRPLLLLLDEPGLTLHGKAQADLLRYFEEKLAPQHQVVFSTHSPFMVPADRLPSVRIVEDLITSPRPGLWVSEGTKVRSDALAVDRDTLFPLQGALGYEITQTMFIGKHTLLVEGPGDILFLQALSGALGRRGRTTLDPRWTICPAGGIDKIQPFVSLFSGARLEIAALTDYSNADRKKLERLLENKVLEGGRLLTFAGILGFEEADVEDIFEPSLYVQIVNGTYSLAKKDQLTVAKIEADAPNTTRVVKRVEASFKLLPPETPEFNHYTPAEWLFLHPEVLDGKGQEVTETLDRAEKVIKALNALL